MFAKLKTGLFVKICIGFVIFIIVVLSAVWLLGPSQLKKYIEANDKEWIGRDVSVQEIKLNPLSFSINVANVIIKEPNSKSDFVSLDNLYINIHFWDLLQSKFTIQELKATKLIANIIQNGNRFNFSDLLNSKEAEKEAQVSEPTIFSLYNINVLNATLNYIDTRLDSKVVLDSISIKDEVFRSIDTVFDATLAIHQPDGGWLKGDVSYNLENSNYSVKSSIINWKLSPFTNYVTSGIRLSEFDGQLDADLELKGNVKADYISSKGQITVADFKMVDPESKPLISMGKLFVDISQIDNKENIYDFKDVLVDNTKVYFEYLPNSDNFSKWLVTENTSSVQKNTHSNYYVSPFEMLSVYIYDMTKEYIFKSYTAERIELANFNLKFQDHTLEDPFYMDLEDVTIKAENIKPDNEFAKFYVNGKINSTGILEGNLLVSRQGVENMNVDMSIKGLFLNRFSPYSRMYTAHRLEEGVASFSNKSEIKGSYLKSTNTLHIEGAEVSKKNKTRNGSSLPMRLAVSLMKDTKGNINLDIPIEGPINDPEYKFRKVVWQIVKNLFTKAVTSPVKSLASVFKVDEKDLKNVYFDSGQIGLSPLQKKSLDNIANVLNKKTDLKIELMHLYNSEYEYDAIALKSAKLSYLKQSDLKLDENIPLGKQAFDLPTSDVGFLSYLKKITPSYDETISIPENARRLLGSEKLKVELEEVLEKQKQLVKEYLISEKSISESRFVIKDGANSEEAINQSRPKFEVSFVAE